MEKRNKSGSEKEMRGYLEDDFKLIVMISLAIGVVLIAANAFNLNIVKTVDYTQIQESNEIAALQSQLEQKQDRIAELEKVQPVDYTPTLIILVIAIAFAIGMAIISWASLKEKELKVREKEIEAKIEEARK